MKDKLEQLLREIVAECNIKVPEHTLRHVINLVLIDLEVGKRPGESGSNFHDYSAMIARLKKDYEARRAHTMAEWDEKWDAGIVEAVIGIQKQLGKIELVSYA